MKIHSHLSIACHVDMSVLNATLLTHPFVEKTEEKADRVFVELKPMENIQYIEFLSEVRRMKNTGVIRYISNGVERVLMLDQAGIPISFGG